MKQLSCFALSLAVVLSSITGISPGLQAKGRALQQKPAVQSEIPFARILECVAALNCKNMTSGRLSTWADTGPPMGMVFQDAGSKYELSLSGPTTKPRDLAIMITTPGETRPGQLLTIDSTGLLVSGSLPNPPGVPAVFRGTREELEALWKKRKSFVAEPRWSGGGSLGEEFRPFWQKQADESLAAIRRQLAK